MSKSFSLLLSGFCVSLYGFDPSGHYRYNEPGFSGEMSITTDPLRPMTHWKILIKTRHDETNHTCDLSVYGSLIPLPSHDITELACVEPQGSGNDDLAKFSLKILKDNLRLTIKNRGEDCGLHATYDGEWHKVSESHHARKALFIQ